MRVTRECVSIRMHRKLAAGVEALSFHACRTSVRLATSRFFWTSRSFEGVRESPTPCPYRFCLHSPDSRTTPTFAHPLWPSCLTPAASQALALTEQPWADDWAPPVDAEHDYIVTVRTHHVECALWTPQHVLAGVSAHVARQQNHGFHTPFSLVDVSTHFTLSIKSPCCVCMYFAA